ncbi:MAG: ADP-ribosyltransferase [Vampirovibrionia bacterium]
MQHAFDIVKNAPSDALAKDIKKQLINKLGLTPAAASTYYHNIKKKLADQKPEEKPVEKQVEKPVEKEKQVQGVKNSYPEEHIKEIMDVIKDNPHASPSMLTGHIKDFYSISEKSAAEMYKLAFDKLHGEKKFKNVDDTIKHEYHNHLDNHGIKNQQDIFSIFTKVKEQHPEISVSKLASKVSNYHHSVKTAKEEPKKSYKDVVDKVESKGSKAKQAEEIYNQMAGKKPKEVKQAFVDKIGMSAATASTYYHNLKKKFGDNPAPEEDLEGIHSGQYEEPAPKNHLDHAIETVKSMKGTGKTGSEIINTIAKKLKIDYSSAMDLAIKANNKLLDQEEKEVKSSPEVDKKQLHGIFDKFFAKEGKKDIIDVLTAAKEKMGLKYAETSKHFNDYQENLIKKMAPTLVDDLYNDYLKGNISSKSEAIDHVSQAFHINPDYAKSVIYQHVHDFASDLVNYYNNAAKNPALTDNDISYGIANKYATPHHIGKNLLQLVQKYNQGTITIDQYKEGLWNIHDKMPQNDMEMKALEIVKKMSGTHSPVDIHDKVSDELDIPYDQALSLINKANKVIEKQKAEEKDKFSGLKIHTYHTEDTHDSTPEEIKQFHRTVQEYKKKDPHEVLKHEHLKWGTKSSKNKKMIEAVREYTGHYYQDINQILRAGSYNPDIKSDLSNRIKNIDAAFEHKSASVPEPIVVYRGVNNNVVQHLQPGDIFQDNGFISTTALQHKAEGWKSEATLHILLPKGAKALSVKDISNYSTESEVLLNRGTKFRIIGTQEGKGMWGDKTTTIFCEVIVDKKKK